MSGFMASILACIIRIAAKMAGRVIAFMISPWFVLGAFVILAALWVYQWLCRPDPENQVTAQDTGLNSEYNRFFAEFDCHELVVDFKNTVPKEEIQSLDIALDGNFQVVHSLHHLYVIESYNCDADLQVLKSSPWVQAVDYNGYYWAMGLFELGESRPNDPLYEKQWNMPMINAEYAWSHTKSGKGVVVAVLDTGVQLSEDLNPQQVLEGEAFESGRWDVDPVGHGTHVAGTIAQWTNNGKGVTGVAKDAKILPVKVLSDQGFGSHANITAGILWAVDQGAQVINMSLGGPTPSKVMEEAIEYAIENGVVVVAAAGNDGRRQISYPAGYEGVSSVAAVGPDGKRSFFSNYGDSVDISAPGGNTRDFGEAGGILQAACRNSRCDYYAFQGTSMASPHVAGAAAILLSEGLRPENVLEVLKTRDKHDQDFGYGIIDLKASLQKLNLGGCSGW